MTLMSLILFMLLQTEGGTVEGVVMKPGGGEPLGGAKVTLVQSRGIMTQQLSATTEDDGHFILSDVPPGDYTLSANSTRYGTAAYGQRRSGGPRTTLSVSAGQRITDIKISMFVTGVIAGRITGRNGQPLVRAAVQAYTPGYRDGKRTLVPVQTSTTNDLGEYRLFWLPAGQYFVAASPSTNAPSPVAVVARAPGIITVDTNRGPLILPDALINESFLSGSVIRRVLDDGTVQEESWIPMYYPGTTEPRDATVINVGAAATMNGVNIAIAPTPVRKISGQVTGPPGLAANVWLLPAASSGGSISSKLATPSFEFKAIKPGSYIAYARDNRTGSVSDQVTIEVGNRDLDGIVLGVRPGVSFTGRLIVESSTDRNPLAGISILLDQGNRELPTASFTPEVPGNNGDSLTGTFVATNVSPGNYQAQVRWLRPDSAGAKPLYVKSVRLGSTDVTNGIPVREGMQPLEIVLGSEYGSVEGQVGDPGRLAGAGATVVLVPSVARWDSSLYKATVADAAGRFHFADIVAGDYLAFAWDDVETGAWANADFMKPFASKGQSVHVSGNSKSDVQVTVLPNP